MMENDHKNSQYLIGINRIIQITSTNYFKLISMRSIKEKKMTTNSISKSS